MRQIIEAIVDAANLAILIRETTNDPDMRRAAERTLAKLHIATDRVATVQHLPSR